MLVKTVHTKKKESLVEENVYECNKYILKRSKEGNFLTIETTDNGVVDITIPSTTSYDETFAVYIMNSNGKTTDSYFFGEFKKDRNIRVKER